MARFELDRYAGGVIANCSPKTARRTVRKRDDPGSTRLGSLCSVTVFRGDPIPHPGRYPLAKASSKRDADVYQVMKRKNHGMVLTWYFTGILGNKAQAGNARRWA